MAYFIESFLKERFACAPQKTLGAYNSTLAFPFLREALYTGFVGFSEGS
jgi:hypothetical protein